MGSGENAGGVGLLAMVMRLMVVPAAVDSGWDHSPMSRCCSCCSGCCWRWEVEEAVHREAVYRSWSRPGSHREYGWASAEGATAV